MRKSVFFLITHHFSDATPPAGGSYKVIWHRFDTL
jgi:hypothetical protein